jgi:hypothetical protein
MVKAACGPAAHERARCTSSTLRRPTFRGFQEQRLLPYCLALLHFSAQMPCDFAQADCPAATEAGKQEVCGNPGVFAHQSQDNVRDGGRRGAVSDGVAEAFLHEALQPLGLYDGIFARRRPQ